MNAINPFDSEEFKKHILRSEGLEETMEEGRVEVIDDPRSSLNSMITSAPKIPSGVKNVIYDASTLAKEDKNAKSAELNLALTDVMSRYNQEYGLDLKIDFSSMANTMVACSDPEKRRVLELYLSEIFQSMRPILILRMISKLTIAIDYILDPQRMFGGELQLTDIWVSIEKILQYIQQLEQMKDDILIAGASSELRRKGDANTLSQSQLDSPEAQEFLKLFKKETET